MDMGLVERIARELAGAYYLVTYDPQIRLHHRQDCDNFALFSFPWVVAGEFIPPA
jgi:hypothetical protein